MSIQDQALKSLAKQKLQDAKYFFKKGSVKRFLAENNYTIPEFPSGIGELQNQIETGDYENAITTGEQLITEYK